MDNQIRILLTAVDQLSGPLGAAEKKLDNFGAKAQAIGANLEKLGTRVGGIGLAGQAALSRMDLDMGSLVSGAINTEKALTNIAVTANLSGDKAKEMVGEWTLAINQLAKDTNQHQASVIAAFGDLVAKGLDPRDAITMLKPIGQAATAAEADIRDMAVAAESGFSKMGIKAGEAAKALDILAMAGKFGGFEIKDMAGYFEDLTSRAEALGIKGKEGLTQLAAAAQISRRASGDASSAANNLANWLSKLNAQTTIKNFENMDENLGEIQAKAKQSGDYIGYMADEIKRITGGDSQKIAALFPDQEAGRFIQRLILDLDDYKKIGEASFNAVGVAAEDFNTQIDTSAEKLKRMQINATAGASEGGVIDGILDSLNGLSDWADKNPDVAKWLIYGTGGLVVGGAVLVGIGATITAIGTLSTAMAGLQTFLIANPAVATLLGLAAAGTAGYVAGTFIADWLDEQVAALSGEKGATLGTKLYDLIEGPNGIITTIGAIPEKLAAQIDEWKAAGANLIVAMRQGIADGLKGPLGIGEKLAAGLEYLKGQGAKWHQAGRDMIQGLIDGVKAKANEVVKTVKDMGGDVLKALKLEWIIKSPSRAFYAVGEMAGEGLRIGILDKVKTVAEAASKLGDAAIVQAGAAAVPEVVSVASALQPRNADGSFKSRADAATQGTGLLGGLNEYAAGVKSVADSTKDMMVRAFNGMEDALVDFVRTGKLNFKSLAESIITDLIRIQVQQSIVKPLASAASSVIGGLFSGNWAGAVGSLLASAKGNAFAHAPGLSAYSGQIVSQPTLFPFAHGVGLMGEAGPEAILPLKRGADGRLGVEGGGAAENNVSINITMNDGQSKVDRQGASALAQQIESVVMGVLVREKRPGGLLVAA